MLVGKRVAVKVIAKGGHKIDLNTKRAESVARELNGLHFEHNHLVQMFGVFTAEDLHTVIIMEYVGKSNLQTIIEKYPTTLTNQFLLR
jgi:serine/threonine protein kinase